VLPHSPFFSDDIFYSIYMER